MIKPRFPKAGTGVLLLSDSEQIAERFQRSFCFMRKHALCKDLAKLDAFLDQLYADGTLAEIAQKYGIDVALIVR